MVIPVATSNNKRLKLSKESNLQPIELFLSLPGAKLQEFCQLNKRILTMQTDEDVQNVFELLEASPPEFFRIADGLGETLLLPACRNSLCRFDLIQHLVDRFPKAPQQKTHFAGELPLHALCNNESFSLEVVRYLVELYPEAVQKKGKGCLPLHNACRNRSCSFDILRYLVEKYPKALEIRTLEISHRDFPLYLACRNRAFSLEMIRYLVQQNPMVLRQTANAYGSFPLHLALSESSPYSVEIVRFLLEQYPDALRQKDDAGLLPLHCCIKGFLRNCYDSQRLFDLMRVLFPGYRDAIDIVPNAMVGHWYYWPAPGEIGRYKQAANLLLEQIHLQDQSKWASQVVEAPESLPIGIEFVREWAVGWLNDCHREIGAIGERLGQLGNVLEESRASV